MFTLFKCNINTPVYKYIFNIFENILIYFKDISTSYKNNQVGTTFVTNLTLIRPLIGWKAQKVS
jgi:hypothetical protein